MSTLKVGIIGIGNVGSSHAQCIFDGKVEGLTLAAVCDINKDLKPLAAQRLPGVAFYENHHDLLSSDVDLVIVSVPHPLHTEIAIDAFKCGKHVLVEKPMDIAASKGRAMMEAAKMSGKTFGIMFNQRTGNLFRKAREIVRGGELGKRKRTTWIITNWYRTQKYYDSGSWRATWAGEGGGVLVNQAPHQLDLWQWICGMPERITAFCEEGKYHRIEVEDSATIFARFPDGCEGTFITSTGEFPGTNRLEIIGTKGKLILEDGKLKWWKLSQDEQEFCHTTEDEFGKIPYTYEEFEQEQGVNGHQAILQNLANHILHGETLIAPGYDGINELLIQNAAYLSAWTGNVPVSIPFDEAQYDRLLARHCADSHMDCSCSNTPGNQYKERWQIEW